MCDMYEIYRGAIYVVYSELCQTFKIEPFDDQKPLTIFTKGSVLDVWQGFESTSENGPDFASLV